MEVMTRKQAIEAGLDQYFTGRPCPKGHVAMRRVSGACCECSRLSTRTYRDKNREKVRAWKRAEQKRNSASANARKLKWYRLNKERADAASAEWAKRNSEKVAERFARRRAAQLQQAPAWADRESISIIYRAARVIRESGFDVHVDHVIPLQGKGVSGLHVPYNLQIMDAKRNQSKGNSFQEI